MKWKWLTLPPWYWHTGMSQRVSDCGVVGRWVGGQGDQNTRERARQFNFHYKKINDIMLNWNSSLLSHGLLLWSSNETQMVNRPGPAQPGLAWLGPTWQPWTGWRHSYCQQKKCQWSQSAIWTKTGPHSQPCIPFNASWELNHRGSIVDQTGKLIWVVEWLCKTDHGKCGVLVL